MVSLILAQKILSLFLMIFMGFLLVRLGILKPKDSKILSLVSLYLVVPCRNITAFQVEYSDDIRNALLIAMAVSLIVQILMVVFSEAAGKILKLDPVEKASAVYSNAGNMVIPIVASMLGPQYVIYTMAYSSIQVFLFWSHCKMTLCGERKINFKKIFMNINMIAVIIGAVLFALKIKLPAIINEPMEAMGSLIGPLAMVVVGMLIGGMDFKKVVTYRRVWLVTAMKLLIVPLLCLPVMKFFPGISSLPDGKNVLMITMMAVAAPCASTVTNMAQIYGRDAEYASACNVVTTLCCILTMPLMIFLYQL